jgi:hypothetical protein
MSSRKGRTASTVSRGFLFLVLVVISAPMLIQIVRDLRAHERVHALEVVRRVPTVENLRAYEKDLADRLVVAAPLRSVYAELGDRLLRRGSSKVLFGDDGWLFYVDDVTYLAAGGLSEVRAGDAHHVDTRPNHALEVIQAFERDLHRLGITLVVVAVPEKATLYPERLVPSIAADAAPNNRGLVDALDALERSGVHVIELTEPLLAAKARGVEVFLPRDTHWSPQGAAVAAEFVAGRLRALGATPNGKRTAFDHAEVAFRARGDLYGMLAYADRGALFSPMTFTVEQVVTRKDHAATQASDSPVLLLGDSFSIYYGDAALGVGRLGGFADHLADELGLPLDVIAIPAGGANRSREALALRREGLGEKRLVLWEFAERELIDRDLVWRSVPLPARHDLPRLPVDEDPTANRPSPPATSSIRAKLVAKSALPARLVYADCLVILRYEPVVPAPPFERPFFVATWGRKDWKPAASAEWSLGAVQRLSLIPARAKPDLDLERTCFAENVDMTEAPWWAESVVAEP